MRSAGRDEHSAGDADAVDRPGALRRAGLLGIGTAVLFVVVPMAMLGAVYLLVGLLLRIYGGD